MFRPLIKSKKRLHAVPASDWRITRICRRVDNEKFRKCAYQLHHVCPSVKLRTRLRGFSRNLLWEVLLKLGGTFKSISDGGHGTRFCEHLDRNTLSVHRSKSCTEWRNLHTSSGPSWSAEHTCVSSINRHLDSRCKWYACRPFKINMSRNCSVLLINAPVV